MSRWPKQVALSFAILNLVVISGGVILWWLCEGDYSLGESIYFALITVSTVGFGEPPELEKYPGTRFVVGGLIFAGLGTIAFFESNLTAMFVEGTLGKAFRRRRMEKRIAKLKDHIIVTGAGRTGRFCIEELSALRRPFIVIDMNEELLEKLSVESFRGELCYVAGDATDDHALIAAGVERAWGLIAALTEDRDNLFVALSARSLNANLRIVAKSLEPENDHKLRKAGVDQLVYPHRIGGVRLVSELIRPRTMEFLDELQAMSGSDLHMEDVEVHEGSKLDGKTIAEAPIRRSTNALVVAIREPGTATFIHNPGPAHLLTAGCHMVVVGDSKGMETLRGLAGVNDEETTRQGHIIPGQPTPG